LDTLAFSLRPLKRFVHASRLVGKLPAKARERPLSAAHRNVEVGGPAEARESGASGEAGGPGRRPSNGGRSL
jgi:hypothetical protein